MDFFHVDFDARDHRFLRLTLSRKPGTGFKCSSVVFYLFTVVSSAIMKPSSYSSTTRRGGARAFAIPAAFLSLLLSAIGTIQTLNFQGYLLQQEQACWKSATETSPAAAATCTDDKPPQKIFLDVGANRGDILRIFYNRGEQPNDSNNRQWKFGIEPYDPTEWRVIAFEASPRMKDALQNLSRTYPFELHVPLAVWTVDHEHIPLGIDDTTEEQKGWLAGVKHGEWGSSVLQNATDTVVTVPTIDLSRFVRDTVCSAQDTVYLKLNVEGAEFPVIRHMMKEGTLCLINHVDIYWHSHLMPEQEQIMWKSTFIPLVQQYITYICDDTKIHIWGVH